MAAKTFRLRAVSRCLGMLAVLGLGGCAGTPAGNWLEQVLAPSPPPKRLPPPAAPPTILNKGLPAGLPVPPAAELVEAWQWEQGGIVRWQVPTALATAVEFYRTQGFQGDRVLLQRAGDRLELVYLQAQETQTVVTLQYARGVPETSPAPVAPKPPPPELLPALQQYLQDLQALDVLSTEAPDRLVKRREFARWLMRANNTLFEDTPARQVRPGRATDLPLFGDVPATDPDFEAIQGLAAAGLIPSTPRFNPEAPLTRQELLIWKVPLDTRRPLPGATVQAVQEAWGFQDVNLLSPRGLQAVLADAAGGDTANLRRILGLTLRLQPEKPVTVAEAAAALWYIGDPKEGRSAQSVLAARKLAAPTPQESTEKN